VHLPIEKGDRSLAEAEGMAAWDKRSVARGDVRSRAKALRNLRDWEKE
jgi:hypothetical protein